jgi:hypothetical protein
MAGKVSFVFGDESIERSNCGFEVENITAVNIDAHITAIATLKTALEAVTHGVIQKSHFTAQTLDYSAVFPADKRAQRENKWFVQMVDSDGHPASMSIPCSNHDVGTLKAAGSDDWNPADAAWVAFVAALEAIAVHPISGLALTVNKITYVGRNV